jgi:hypothetical protein
MSEKVHDFMPASAEMPSDNQRLFARYFTGILIDLTVLNLFAEYWSSVHVSNFTISLLAAVLLQILLKLTIAVEHKVAGLFTGKSGGAWMTPALLLRLAGAVRFEIRDPRGDHLRIRA